MVFFSDKVLRKREREREKLLILSSKISTNFFLNLQVKQSVHIMLVKLYIKISKSINSILLNVSFILLNKKTNKENDNLLNNKL